jgi:DNA-binding HxlR family transcriptional regulator
MAKYSEQFMKCPMVTVQNLIGGKWKTYLLNVLHDGPKRFSDLHRALPDVTQSMLTNTLRDLERDGLVHREVYKQVPPKVEYSLTPIAIEFLPVLEQMLEWGIRYMEHRGTYDEETAKLVAGINAASL